VGPLAARDVRSDIVGTIVGPNEAVAGVLLGVVMVPACLVSWVRSCVLLREVFLLACSACSLMVCGEHSNVGEQGTWRTFEQRSHHTV
jgi:hypothetical protein